MNASGVIYVAIVAAWFAVLVPRWLRRNEEVERAREVDESRGVRVIEPRATRMRARSRSSRAVVRQPVPAPPRSDHAARLAFRAGARRRRRVLLLLVLATTGVGAAAIVAAIPPVWVAVPAGLLVTFGVLARRAAAAERRRLSAEHDIAAEEDAVADDARAATEDAESEPAVATVAVDDEVEALDVDTDGWEPVSVPPPIYVTKARAEPAVNRSINLSGAGAWTSTRVDAADDIVLPRRGSAHRSAAASTADPTAAAVRGGGDQWDDRDELEYRPAVGE